MELNFINIEFIGIILLKTHHSFIPPSMEYAPMPAPPPQSNGQEAVFHELSLPLERVFFVDSQQSLDHCQQLLLKVHLGQVLW